MFKVLQNWFTDYLTRNLLKAITKKEILQVKGGRLFIKGKEVSNAKRIKVTEDARKFKNSAIWKLINNKVKWTIQDKMVRKSKSVEDMRAGKMGLYIVNLINEILEDLSEL